jgi:hypothetical protein
VTELSDGRSSGERTYEGIVFCFGVVEESVVLLGDGGKE